MPLAEAERDGALVAIIENIQKIPGPRGNRFRGLHFYDGHASKWEAGEQREAKTKELYDRLTDICENLEAEGFQVGELVTSGTHSAISSASHCRLSSLSGTIHRSSPGTVVFHDLRSHFTNPLLRNLEPAALICSRVVSHPREDIVTVDCGSKSMAAETGNPICSVVGHPSMVPLSPSEEHLPIKTFGQKPFKRGQDVYLVPRHVCPSVNLAQSAVWVSESGGFSIVEIDAQGREFSLSQN